MTSHEAQQEKRTSGEHLIVPLHHLVVVCSFLQNFVLFFGRHCLRLHSSANRRKDVTNPGYQRRRDNNHSLQTVWALFVRTCFVGKRCLSKTLERKIRSQVKRTWRTASQKKCWLIAFDRDIRQGLLEWDHGATLSKYFRTLHHHLFWQNKRERHNLFFLFTWIWQDLNKDRSDCHKLFLNQSFNTQVLLTTMIGWLFFFGRVPAGEFFLWLVLLKGEF